MNAVCNITRHIDLDQALQRARADYREMPGLQLTARQASRLWALPTRCASASSARSSKSGS
jgi:hypothetical protein